MECNFLLCENNRTNSLLLKKDRGSDGMQKQLDTISKLTGKVEHYEMELKIAEDRCAAVNAQLETQVILCRDREKQVLQLQEEVV